MPIAIPPLDMPAAMALERLAAVDTVYPELGLEGAVAKGLDSWS